MSGHMIQRATRPHSCSPGWTTDGFYCHPPGPHAFAPGDVWQCDCGQFWVASDARSNHNTVGQRSVGAVDWTKPTRRQLKRLASDGWPL